MSRGFRFVENPSSVLVGVPRKWPSGTEKLFAKRNEKVGTGTGEKSVVAALLGIEVWDPDDAELDHLLTSFLQGQHSTFDIEITPERCAEIGANPHPDHFGKWEVKMPDSSSNIAAGQEGGNVVQSHYAFFREVSSCILLVTRELDLESYVSQHAAAIRLFAEEDVPSILNLNLSKGRVFGSRVQPHGLLQIGRYLSEIRTTIPDERKSVLCSLGDSKVEIPVWNLAPVLRSAGISRRDQMISALVAVGFTEKQAQVLRCLSHPFFGDPDMLYQEWKTLAPPSEVFTNVKGVIQVSPTYICAMLASQLDGEFVLDRLTRGGRPNYKTQFKNRITSISARSEPAPACSPAPSTETQQIASAI